MDCVIISIIFIISLIIKWSAVWEPFRQIVPGSFANHTFGYPIQPSTVPSSVMLSVYGFTWSLLLIGNGMLMWKWDASFTLKKWLKFVYLKFRVVAFAFSVNELVTDIIKKVVGQPRPYWLMAEKEWNQGQMDEHEWYNANQSFVSGHSSESWGLAFLLSLYLYSSYAYTMKCYAMNQKIAIYSCTNPHSYFLSNVWYTLADFPLVSIGFIFMPCYGSLYVSLTRVRDYKHTPAEIKGGGLLGCFVSYLAYLIYYDEMYLAFELKRSLKRDCDAQENETKRDRQQTEEENV